MADRRLQVFRAAARELSFTKAGDVLYMTQPAVSFQVTQLEEALNVRLFDRVHNKIRLTAVGEQVYHYAQEILGLYDDMERAVRDLTEDNARNMLLGASTSVADYLFPSLLAEFKYGHPHITVQLRVANTEKIVSLVENCEIDMAVVEGPVAGKSLHIEPCHMDSLVIIAPPDHPLAERRQIPARELEELPFIAGERGSGTRDVLHDYLQSNGLDPADLQPAMEIGNPETIKGAVAAGLGISIVSRASVHKELRLGTLVALELLPAMKRPYSLVYQKQKFRSRISQEFLEFARQHCHNLESPDGCGLEQEAWPVTKQAASA
jgi:DNA-binding transcriptional LysR family regulator